MGSKVDELRQKRAQLLEQAQALVEAAEAEDRDLTPEEREQFDALLRQADELAQRIERLERVAREVRALEQVQREGLKPQPEQGEPRGLIGMEKRDLERYSLLRAIRAAASGDWREAGLEREASEAVAKRLGREPRGFFVPYDVLTYEQRGLLKGTAAQGGYLVGQEPITFIEMLRARMVLQRAGARFVTGLVGDLPLTRMTGGATAQWVAENAEATESNYAFEQVVLSPKTVSATTGISRKMLLQSSEDVEALVREDLAQVIALAIERAALHGSGTAPEPQGLATHSGVSVVSIGANGGAPTWQHIVELETAIAQQNADVERMAYVTNPKVRGYLKVTPKEAGYPTYIWGDGPTPLNGYRAFVTTQVRSDLTKGTGTGLSAIFFGNWADLFIGVWGNGMDLLVDPYTQGRKGQLLVTAFMDVDVEPRHPESFAVILDAAV